MARNKSLNAAIKARKDEFYTLLPDIENELRYYKKHFRGKSVLCNCDDPYESNFFKYFAMNFNQLGLKKLTATCYNGSPIAGKELQLFPIDDESDRTAWKIEITEVADMNGDGATNLSDVEYLIRNNKNVLTRLKCNGDFRSDECVALLKETDIVVTNPPFSLFREYVAQLMEYGKKFLIIGNQNNITYKEIFPLLMSNKIWLGVNCNKTLEFKMPDTYEYWNRIEDGVKIGKVSGITWFTNLDHDKRHDEIDLCKRYTPEEYPVYVNYDAIEVGFVSDIPCDYNGVMGVPITFMHKYCPEQFEIIGIGLELADMNIIREKKGKLDGGPRLYISKNGELTRMYERVLIRKKKND